MSEEERTVVENGDGNPSTPDYLATIKQLKENRVSKADYDKLMADNKALQEMIVNGQEPQVEQVVKSRDVREILKDLNNSTNTNLDYTKYLLEYRKAYFEKFGKDCFSGEGFNAKFSEADNETAQRVADVMQQCIDDCENDPTLFNALFQRRMNEVKIPPRR